MYIKAPNSSYVRFSGDHYPPPSPAPPLTQSGLGMLYFKMFNELYQCWFCSVTLSMLGYMDTQGVLAQNRTIPPILTAC